MSTVSIKRNDTGIVFTDTLIKNNVALDLTGASVKFLLKKGLVEFSAVATITDQLNGGVSYGPGPYPTELGTYRQEWEVTFQDGSILTFPSDQHNEVNILQDLNPL